MYVNVSGRTFNYNYNNYLILKAMVLGQNVTDKIFKKIVEMKNSIYHTFLFQKIRFLVVKINTYVLIAIYFRYDSK